MSNNNLFNNGRFIAAGNSRTASTQNTSGEKNTQNQGSQGEQTQKGPAAGSTEPACLLLGGKGRGRRAHILGLLILLDWGSCGNLPDLGHSRLVLLPSDFLNDLLRNLFDPSNFLDDLLGDLFDPSDFLDDLLGDLLDLLDHHWLPDLSDFSEGDGAGDGDGSGNYVNFFLTLLKGVGIAMIEGHLALGSGVGGGSVKGGGDCGNSGACNVVVAISVAVGGGGDGDGIGHHVGLGHQGSSHDVGDWGHGAGLKDKYFRLQEFPLVLKLTLGFMNGYDNYFMILNKIYSIYSAKTSDPIRLDLHLTADLLSEGTAGAFLEYQIYRAEPVQIFYFIKFEFTMEYSQLLIASSPRFSPDAEYFVYFQEKSLSINLSSVDPKELHRIELPDIIKSAEISSDSKYVAALVPAKSLVMVYKLEDRTLVARIEDSHSVLTSLYWIRNSLQLMVFSELMYKASIYNLANNSVAYLKAPKHSTPNGHAFSSDGKFLAMLEKHDSKDCLTIYCTLDWKVVNLYKLDPLDAWEVKWTPNDAYIAVSDSYLNYRMLVFSHMMGLVLNYSPYDLGLGVRQYSFSNNSLFLAVGSYDEKVRLLNCLTWAQIAELDCAAMVINSQRTVVHVQEESKENRMKTVQEKMYKIPTRKQAPPKQDSINEGISVVEFSQDDKYLACKSQNLPHVVWIWEMSSLELVSLVVISGTVRGMKWATKENYLCITFDSNRLLFWKPDTSIVECVFHLNARFDKVQWSRDGGKALIIEAKRKNMCYAEFVPNCFDNGNM